MALLVAMATLGGTTAAGASPIAGASVTIESSTILVGGKRGWSKGGFHHRWSSGHHKRFHAGRHRPAFAGRRFHKAPVVVVQRAPAVVVTPAFGAWAGYRYLPGRPLIVNGRFTRQSFRW
ncbi:MAG TPA: hypothetical protein VFV80_02430 [Geminicoccaceae bacterium]|nr:hypothetical protein [Geminicoccaceae bacterium]